MAHVLGCDKAAASPGLRTCRVGKTTLLSQRLAAEGQDDSRVAWLSLEPDDSDLRRFLTRVVATLPDCSATFGEHV